jgi:hypothetical protein
VVLEESGARREWFPEFGLAIALHGSAALPFVIPSAAEGSAVPLHR